MPTAKVTSKGQITIPVEVRKALNLKPGESVDFYKSGDGEFVFRARNRSILELEGCLAGYGPPLTIEEMDEAIGQAVTEDYLRSVGELPSQESKGEAA
jgi:antitoxin PrlF